MLFRSVPVDPPNAASVERLLRKRAGELIAESEDLTNVAFQLEGMMPVVVHELATRAKIVAMNRKLEGGDMVVTAMDLEKLVPTIRDHAELAMRRSHRDTRSDIEKAADTLGTKLANAVVFSETGAQV